MSAPMIGAATITAAIASMGPRREFPGTAARHPQSVDQLLSLRAALSRPQRVAAHREQYPPWQHNLHHWANRPNADPPLSVASFAAILPEAEHQTQGLDPED